MSTKEYTQGEEIANAVTHGLGIVFGVVAGAFLLKMAMRTQDVWAITSVWMYIIGMVSSYVTSTLYHSATNQKRKAQLRRYDHAAIYFHIAGTYTPFTIYLLRNVGAWGWSLFTVVWMAAIAGTILSFTHQKAGSKLETVCYVLIGSVILIALKPLIDTLSLTGSLDAVYWLVGGGVSYILGAVIYSFKKIKYMHSVFHLFVLGGSVCHVLAIRCLF